MQNAEKQFAKTRSEADKLKLETAQAAIPVLSALCVLLADRPFPYRRGPLREGSAVLSPAASISA